EGETLHLFTVARHLRLQYVDRLLHAGDAADEGGRLTAPMPGKVIALLVQPGERVRKGQPLLVMEAMKMEHTITAPADGQVGRLHYGLGDQVPEGEELVSLESPAAPEAAASSRRGPPWSPAASARPACRSAASTRRPASAKAASGPWTRSRPGAACPTRSGRRSGTRSAAAVPPVVAPSCRPRRRRTDPPAGRVGRPAP